MGTAVPKPPEGSGPSGRVLWTSVVEQYDLDQHELLLLKEACRTADLLDRLADSAAGDSVTARTGKGDLIAHPAITESRQQRLALARLLASLRLPSGEELGDRPQRRGAARGSYGLRGVV